MVSTGIAKLSRRRQSCPFRPKHSLPPILLNKTRLRRGYLAGWSRPSSTLGSANVYRSDFLVAKLDHVALDMHVPFHPLGSYLFIKNFHLMTASLQMSFLHQWRLIRA